MVKCKLNEEDGACISCKVCGYEIKKLCNKYRLPLTLTAHIPINCVHRHTCHENHCTNASSMGKSKLAGMILELIDDD